LDLWGHRHAPSLVALVTVFLSVAHLDHDPTNNRLRNLKALCAQCHLRHDVDHHRQTRRAKKAIGDLFEARPS
jgi:5-methylcytosine-specific restriction endonuclease McrA